MEKQYFGCHTFAEILSGIEKSSKLIRGLVGWGSIQIWVQKSSPSLGIGTFHGQFIRIWGPPKELELFRKNVNFGFEIPKVRPLPETKNSHGQLLLQIWQDSPRHATHPPRPLTFNVNPSWTPDMECLVLLYFYKDSIACQQVRLTCSSHAIKWCGFNFHAEREIRHFGHLCSSNIFWWLVE